MHFEKGIHETVIVGTTNRDIPILSTVNNVSHLRSTAHKHNNLGEGITLEEEKDSTGTNKALPLSHYSIRSWVRLYQLATP